MKLFLAIFIAFAAMNIAYADVRFNIVNESMPVWVVTTTSTAPSGSACQTFETGGGDPDYHRGTNCDELNRCLPPVTIFENTAGQHLMAVYTDDGCYEILEFHNQAYQGFHIETIKETANGGIWYQGWAADGGNAFTKRWLDLTIEFDPWLHAYDGVPEEKYDPLTDTTYFIEDKGIAEFELVIELRWPSGGPVFWRKVIQGYNSQMTGWPGFPGNNPLEEVFAPGQSKLYRIPVTGAPSFVAYVRSSLRAASGEVRSGDIGNAANARNAWSISFTVSDRE